MKKRLPIIPLFLFLFSITFLKAQNTPPNILFIIADDLGVDVSNGYHTGNLRPTTPTLDSLRAAGITFENVFAAPACSPTRASIMSGKFGVKTGVTSVPGHLDLAHTSIFKELENQTNKEYADAAIGKWHLSSPADPQHPLDHGADYFMGLLGGAPADYYAWSKTENGTTAIDSSYITSSITDASINWINAQTQPWFLWLAHPAPHSPYHEPPSHMYSVSPTGNNYRKYLAMIESVDYEINRLLYSIPTAVRENTLIVFVGDNGTPGNVMQDYPAGHGKGSLYQGGVRVPLIVAGAGVTRQGERESALVHVNDLYATFLEVAGADLPGGLYNSLSFKHLLTGEDRPTRDYNYTETSNMGNNGWATRGPQYKLIEYSDGNQEMYDLLSDSLELNDLLNAPLSMEQTMIKNDLEAEAQQIRSAWSCRDHIKNGEEEDIDCGGTYCLPCTTTKLNDLDQAVDIQVFPNPGDQYFTVNSGREVIREIVVFNSLGKILLVKSAINANQANIAINDLNPQVLYLEIKLATQTKMVKLIKAP